MTQSQDRTCGDREGHSPPVPANQPTACDAEEKTGAGQWKVVVDPQVIAQMLSFKWCHVLPLRKHEVHAVTPRIQINLPYRGKSVEHKQRPCETGTDLAADQPAGGTKQQWRQCGQSE